MAGDADAPTDTWTEVNWKPGTLFVPPGRWWHQHFNTGSEPARYLAIRWGGNKWKLAEYLDNQGVDKDVNEGGNQIEYEDQDPTIHRTYVERCAAKRRPGEDGRVQRPRLALTDVGASAPRRTSWSSRPRS